MKLQEALQQAMQAHQSGDLRRAEAIYRGILSHLPNHPDALNLLGIIALQTGRFDQAADLITKAIAAAPATASFHFNLGMVLAAQQKLNPAIAAFQQALQLEPAHAAAWSRLADALYESHHPIQAAAAARRAIELQPALADAHNALGKSLHAEGNRDAAIACFRQAITLMPKYAQACSNLGQTLCECAHFDEAVTWCKRAIDIQPDFAQAHWNLALMLLRLGDWEHGWPEYEWRWRIGNRRIPYPQPIWDGSDLNGKRILLHAEQGLGDTIQFIRYLPLISDRGGKIIVAAQPELLPLLRTIPGIEHCLAPGDTLPDFAVQCPLPSLPGVFKATLANIPAMIPYLTADPARAARWLARMTPLPPKRIGLAWTGNPQNPDHLNRSIPLAALAPLAGLNGVVFLSLQKGDGAKDAAAPMPLLDWTDELNDLADTAALMENLDLVITADTVIAHLAGAMGKPVWILLPKVPDWRWLLGRADSPWYPTARLFRQQTRGDWTSPVNQAAHALGKLD